ncbi:hypothetical protein HBI88_064890 [Parastagonospora nodorum]|nr:hypothetical protein HBI97_002700 [Parastagonospora nodorum]KAH5833842.1 hypothetical protein HBI94_028640 [Parastagonospora nodorum]KAH5842374.1 hypothetical protein HBI93_020540 [Parastagonospora nodorum]KAH5843328.1 hypothetical protein HBI96_000650 [Parastagonospora nodorum]KAH5869881.1 hypothetical protein HBI91_077740 [Parastagonospora nodorum]
MDIPFLHWTEVPHRPESDEGIDQTASQKQLLTDLIFKKLVDEGSNIRVIAWYPPSGKHVATWDKRADLNGHIWPECAYYKGRVTGWCRVNEVVAVPIPNFREGMAESSILDC